MNKQFEEFNELTTNASNYLEHKLCYAVRTIHEYKKVWKQLREFIFSRSFTGYDKMVEEQFLQFKFKGKKRQDLTINQRVIYNGIKMLTEFNQTGRISVPKQPSKYPLEFNGAIGSFINDFVKFKSQYRMSRSSLQTYQRNLFDFMNYCDKKEIFCIKEIELTTLLQFLNQYSSDKKTAMTIMISTLRSFMLYLFEHKIVSVDYSSKLPKSKVIIQPKIPSTYSKSEIEKLIRSVDRASSTGKRNYAIILIAARLGLRASDISRLKFENLHWDTNTIEINQVKTGNKLTLPLLPDVGNAIIDYLKYGRPESKELYIFLTARPPYSYFSTSNVVTHVVQRAIRKAGIDISNRRFGSHSLRHSLGFRMLEDSTVLPVISEVLGHKNTESTRYYLRIDLTSMKQCMLDVPPVSTDFYQQRGGAFYE